MSFLDRSKPINVRWLNNKRSIVGLLCGVVIVLIMVVWQPISKSVPIASIEVTEGEFIVDINSNGEIDALKSTSVSIPRFRRRMSMQIVEMAEEGAEVAADDFLLQLDTSEAQQAVEEAENDLETAKVELTKEEASIASNMAQLESQLERERYSFEQSELTQRMMEYEAETKRREYELNMKKAELALDQAGQKIVSQGIINEATIRKAQLSIQQAEADLKKANEEMSDLTLTAPIAGMVVYQKTWSGSGWRKVQVGDTPWPGMAVLSIPDLSRMTAKFTINEVDISKVALDQELIITVDALGGETFNGVVSRIAPLARNDQSTNAKVFDIETLIDSTAVQLRPGMTCDCRLITKRIPGVFSVPIQAVFEKDGNTVVFLLNGNNPHRQEVVLGERGREFVVVESGIEAGDRICLRDPTIALVEAMESGPDDNGFPKMD